MQWRVIITDSESLTGVAPVCPEQGKIEGQHGRDDSNDAWADDSGVYDCCPHPHIETWSETAAARVAELLNHANAEPAGS